MVSKLVSCYLDFWCILISSKVYIKKEIPALFLKQPPANGFVAL
jgi:hypothetical protein